MITNLILSRRSDSAEVTRLALLPLALGALTGVACDGTNSLTDSVTDPGVPTIVAVSDVHISGVVGQAAVPGPHVRVLDAHGRPLAGEAVEFVVLWGGGSVTPADTLTDGNGEARAQWVLGTRAANAVLAVRAGSPRGELKFLAVQQAGPAARLGTYDYGHIDNVAFVGENVGAPAVTVVDEYSNPAASADVSFFVAEGGGRLEDGRDTIQGAVTNYLCCTVVKLPVGWIMGAAGVNRLTAKLPNHNAMSFDVVALDHASVQWYATAGDSRKLALSNNGHFILEAFWEDGTRSRFTGTYAINADKLTLNGCWLNFWDVGDRVCQQMTGTVGSDSIDIDTDTYRKK